MTPSRTSRALDADALAGGLVLALALYLFAQPATDPDFGWHVANGRHLLDGVLFAGRDVYSWTAAGATWIAHEWLSEGVMAFLHDTLGAWSDSFLVALMGVCAIAAVEWRLRQRGIGGVPLAVTSLLAVIAAIPILGVRPLVVEVVGVALLLALLDAWWDGRLGAGWFLVVVGLLAAGWANAHGSFVLAPVILAVAAAAAALARDRRAGLLVGAAGVALVAPLANPFGPALYAYVGTATGGSRLGLIMEWAPPDLADPKFIPLAAAMLLAAAGAIVGLRRGWPSRRWWDSGTGRPYDLPLAIGFGLAAAQTARHGSVFALVAAPLIASAVGLVVHGLLRRSPGAGAPVRPRLNAAILASAFALALLGVQLRAGPAAQAAEATAAFPEAALPGLDDLACARGGSLHLLNDYGWGGWLTMVRPSIRVFIDGRSEVYGDAGVTGYADIIDVKPGWQAQLDGVGVNAVLLHREEPLVSALLGLRWRTAWLDGQSALLVRPEPIDTTLDDGTRCPRS